MVDCTNYGEGKRQDLLQRPETGGGHAKERNSTDYDIRKDITRRWVEDETGSGTRPMEKQEEALQQTLEDIVRIGGTTLNQRGDLTAARIKWDQQRGVRSQIDIRKEMYT